MKPVVVLAVIIGSSFAAPIEETEELLRTKKSFGAPCAGAVPYAPVSLYLNQSPAHYREEEHFEEHQARSGYESSLAGLSGYSGASAASSGYGSGLHTSLGGSALSGGGYGSAVGLFPHANVGGCNVPLLLSCAPNVVAGHLTESHGYSSGYHAPAYRNIEEESMKEEWAKMARAASHHKISEDYPVSQKAQPAGPAVTTSCLRTFQSQI